MFMSQINLQMNQESMRNIFAKAMKFEKVCKMLPKMQQLDKVNNYFEGCAAKNDISFLSGR